MSSSIFGRQFSISTWGESHGKALGVTIDGCPAGLPLCEEDIQMFLDRRKPGQSRFTTQRKEADSVEILSGVFDGRTTGTPIAMIVFNKDQRSRDYGDIASYYRPGHADYTFDEKYGFRDYRGGGRSSGRETIGRVAAGAIASKILSELGVSLCTYAKSIGSISIPDSEIRREEITENKLYMPNNRYAKKAEAYLEECISHLDSCGGIIECVIEHFPVGIGDPVFEKCSANLAKAICSIGAVKGFEIGDGFAVSASHGSTNNDVFRATEDGTVVKETNHSGGMLGGISDGSPIIFRAAVKPTPSIAQEQNTINQSHENISVQIKGRHDPIIVPRAVVVVESMAAIALVDMLFASMTARMDRIVDFFKKPSK